MIFLTFSKICIYLIIVFLLLKNKYVYFHKNFSIIICGWNMLKGQIFSESLYPMKYLKSFLPNRSLLDTTILLIPISFIEVWLLFDEIYIFKFQCHQIL